MNEAEPRPPRASRQSVTTADQRSTVFQLPKFPRALRCCGNLVWLFENEVAILMGSNSEFLKETRPMATWLDVERLYLSRKDSGRALKLLPLVQVGPSPQSAKNACYFFNRLERDGARFVSYHFTDKPELMGQFNDATDTIKFLTQV